MNVEVTVRGDVSEALRETARAEVDRLEPLAGGAPLGARVVLVQEENPRIALPARAEGEVVLSGGLVRVRVAGASMEEAVNELGDSLKRQLRRHVERLMTTHREPPEGPPGEWRHASWSRPRPGFFPRAPQEREIVRRKSFAFGPMSLAEAVADLDALDHDFFLFSDAASGADAVLYRRDDGRLGLIEPGGVARSPSEDGPIREPSRFSEATGLDVAVREMDALNHRFLFFVNADTGRGNVLYLRYDGHYGLIEPA